MEYSEIVEIPEDFNDEDIKALIDIRYNDVDGGSYSLDPEYWRRIDEPRYYEMDPCAKAQGVANKEEGSIFFQKVA